MTSEATVVLSAAAGSSAGSVLSPDVAKIQRDMLALLLEQIAEHDPSWTRTGIDSEEDAYAYRNALIFQALGTALTLGYPGGVGFDPLDPERPVVVYIELPTGQVSWHVPAYEGWDGHSTKTKYARATAYVEQVDAETETVGD